jgi:hypothetical protein
MSLENLEKIGRLKAHKAAPQEVVRLIQSAAASLADARRKENSPNSRLDLAYKAIMQLSLAALMANGYRPSTSEPGHQQTTIQTLPKTIGLPAEKTRLFDAFRRARNVADYEGDPVGEGLVKECIDAAEDLRADVLKWLKGNRPDLC